MVRVPLAVVAVVAAVVIVGAGLGGYLASRDGRTLPRHAASSASTRGPRAKPRSTTTTSAAITTTSTTSPPPPTTTTGPGTLPQTATLPPASSAQFDAQMQDLWHAVVADDVTAALPAFFPKGAYVQLKSIADAAVDWQDRLVGDLRADVGAAHALLGAGAPGAQLVGVNVPEPYAHWIQPGVCDNSIGYWEVPNARVVYRATGAAVRSFGIASMISWRGVWYVVHLGAVLRPTTTTHGVVDDPATGPGVSAYSSTC